MNAFLRRLWHVVRRSRQDADLREEIETHRTLRQARLEREGLDPLSAAEASRRALGNVTLAREEARGVWLAPALDDVAQDVRLVVRGLLKSPGLAAVTIATLALGIGANTALFSIFNSLLLRPLQVKDPSSLVLVEGGDWTYAIWESIRAHEDAVFDGVFAWGNTSFDLSSGGQVQPADGAFVSGRMFDVLGVTPARGRLLGVDDDRTNAPGSSAVISERFWQQHFGGADNVVGRTFSLQHVPFTIVGVMPASFAGPDVGRVTDIMVPFSAEPLIKGSNSVLRQRSTWWIGIMGRLKPGQTLEQAARALRGIQPQIREESMPEGQRGHLEEPLTLAPAATGTSGLRARFELPLVAMLGAVGLLLLVACANIANLLLTRALSRRRELSVRLALGSSRWRLARLLMTETAVIVSCGAGLGLLFAGWSSAFMVRQAVTWRGAIALDLPLDWRVLGFTTLLAGLTALVAGIAPALGVRHMAPADAMRSGSRAVAGDGRSKLRATLVVAQIALSLVLVIGAGLFLRTFTSLSRSPLGFTPDGLSVVSLNLDAVPAEARLQLLNRTLEAARSVPGIRAAGLSVITPITGAGWNGLVGPAAPGPPDRTRMTWLNAVTPSWFDTMGVRFVGGRNFDTRDVQGAVPVAIVNETFARRFLAGRQPIGEQIEIGGPRDQTRYLVVGVVGDAVYRSLREGLVPTAYLPLAQERRVSASTPLTIAVEPSAVTAARGVATALRQVDPAIAFTIRGFDEFIQGALALERLVAVLSGFFGLMAVLLAAIGLYGVVAHAVGQRRSEIGIRMALGASATGIAALIARRVALLLVAGTVVGLTLSAWLGGLITALLFRIDARDPLAFTSGLVVLALAALAATWFPARRATRVDPAAVLREG